jgi:hypothetical protein
MLEELFPVVLHHRTAILFYLFPLSEGYILDSGAQLLAFSPSAILDT